MKRRLPLLAALVGVTASMAAIAPTVSGPAFGDTNGCPTGKYSTTLTSNLVGATTTVSSNTVTYVFNSFVDRHPVSGVPGLIEYCVYSDAAPDSTSVSALG